MKTRIVHILKQFIAICTLTALLLSTVGVPVTIAHAAENDFEEVTLSLNSTVVDNIFIDLYLYDSVYYISIDDLCALTRCSQSVDGDIISVTHGIWYADFDVENQLFDDGYQSVDTTILEVSTGKYAVPALMFLSYYKAVAFIQDDTLYCRMPECTAWEALNVDYGNSLVDIYKLYGGEGNVKLSLTMDIIMDFIMGDMSTSDDYLSDAFLMALKVDLYGYSSVKEYKESSQNELYSELHSDEGVEFVEAIENTLSIAAEPTEWYIQYYYNAIEKSFVNLAYNAYEAGQHSDVTHYGEKFYEAFTEKNKTSETAEKYFDNMDYVMLFVSAAAETAQQMKYVNATNNLIYNVMGQENLNYLGISAADNDWFTVANRYQNVLGVAATELEAEAMQLFTDKLCWETLIGTGVTSATGISRGAWNFSLNSARLFVEKFPLTSSSIEAFEADRRALYLSELQQNVYWVAQNTLLDMQGQLDNPEIYSKYIYAQQLYCRTSIAMYENLITMIDEFGENRDYWVNLFRARIDMLAVSLYQLTTIQDDGVSNCLPLNLDTFEYNSVKEISNKERYQAYAELIENYESKYGIAKVHTESEWFSYMTGLCFMKLVDFTQSNQENLLLVYQKTDEPSNIYTLTEYTFEIWGFENNEFTMLDSGGLFGTDGGVRAVYLTEYNENTYLVTGGMDSFGYYYYHGYSNGKFGIVREAKWDWDEEYICSIDGVDVTYQEFQTEQEKWLSNSVEYNLNYDCDDILLLNEETKKVLSPY